MQDAPLAGIREVRRMPSPVPRPQTLAFHEGRFWLSPRDVPTLYRLDERWHASDTAAAPGSIWGLTASPTGLTAVCGLGQDDDRYIYHYVYGEGFEPKGIACPNFTGCYVTYDADAQLYLSQVHYSRILVLDEGGNEQKGFDAPHGLCGICWARGALYLIGTDNENADECYLSRLAFSGTGYNVRDIARVPFQARSLAFDGELLWSNHRDRDPNRGVRAAYSLTSNPHVALCGSLKAVKVQYRRQLGAAALSLQTPRARAGRVALHSMVKFSA